MALYSLPLVSTKIVPVDSLMERKANKGPEKLSNISVQGRTAHPPFTLQRCFSGCPGAETVAGLSPAAPDLTTTSFPKGYGTCLCRCTRRRSQVGDPNCSLKEGFPQQASDFAALASFHGRHRAALPPPCKTTPNCAPASPILKPLGQQCLLHRPGPPAPPACPARPPLRPRFL